MDIQPQTAKPISDDQELAKVLAGVSNDVDNLNFDEPPVTPMPAPVVAPAITTPSDSVVGYNTPDGAAASDSDNSNSLDSIKKTALTELRPLVDKLNLDPEEKFNIYLLLLRSTDDTTLIAPAHETARGIADESKRAEALLDIIKEIDFLSNPTQQAK